VMTEADSAVATVERLPAWVAAVPCLVSKEFLCRLGVNSLWIRRHTKSTTLVLVCLYVFVSCLTESSCGNVQDVHSFICALLRLLSI
jgi:hypothetical protein